MAKSHFKWSILLGERDCEYAFAPAKALSWHPKQSKLLVSGFMADVENSPVPSHPGPTLWLVDKDGQVENIKEVLGCKNVAWSNEGSTFASSQPLAIHQAPKAKAKVSKFLLKALKDGEKCGTKFISWSPDDKLIAANEGSNICIFSTKSKKRLATYKSKRKKMPVSASWSSSGLLYVAWEYESIIALDDKGVEQLRLKDKETSGLIACSPDGKYLADLFDGKRAIRIRSLANLQKNNKKGSDFITLRGHSEINTDCCWSPCSKYLATSSFDGTLRIWRHADGAEVLKTNPDECRLPEKIAWSQGGRWLAAICSVFGKYSYRLMNFDVGDYPSLRKRKVATCRHVTWRTVDQEVLALALAPKGKTVYLSGYPGHVAAYSTSTWQQRWSLEFAKDTSVSHLKLSTDGKILAIAADNGHIRIVDSRKGTKKWFIEEFAVDKSARNFYIAGIHLLGGGTLLGVHTSSFDKCSFQLFDWQNGKELWRKNTTENFTIAPAPTGSHIALSSYSYLYLYQAQNGKERWKVTVDFPDELLWLSDVNALVVAYSGNVTLLDGAKGKLLWSESHPFASKPKVAYSPAKAILAISVAWSKIIHLRDSRSGELLGTIESHFDNAITELAFACGGKYLVTASVDQFIRIFSVPDGKLEARMQYPSGHPRLLALSATGKLLTANDCAKKMPLWDLSHLS